MNKALKLAKIMFVETLANNFSSNKKKEKRHGVAAIAIILGLVMLFLYFALIPFGYDYGQKFAQIELVNALLAIILIGGTVIIFFLSIFTNLSIYFLSNDIPKLLPLPLKAWQILFAKLLTSFFFSALQSLVFVLPILIGVGAGANLPFCYYLYAIITAILLPLIPSLISATIITIALRFSNVAKSKDKFTYLMIISMVGFMIFLQFFINFTLNKQLKDGVQLQDAGIEKINRTVNILENIFIFIKPINYSLNHPNTIWAVLTLLLFISIIAIFIIIFFYVGEKIYFKAILSGYQKKGKKSIVKIDSKKSSLFKNYILKEWRLIVRSPIFNLNYLLVHIIILVTVFGSIILVSFQYGANNEAMELFKNININIKNTGSILIFLSIICFVCSMTMTSSTAISRDGGNAIFVKYIPVRPATQIHAKVFLGVIISIFMTLFYEIVCVYFGILSISAALLILVPTILFIIFSNYLSIIIDLRFPKLKWSNENQVAKQNVYPLIIMLIDWGIAILLLIIGIILLNIREVWVTLTIVGVLSIIFGIFVISLYRYFADPKSNIFKRVY